MTATQTASHVFPRAGSATLPTVVAGDGVYLIDDAGKRYLDGCGGAAVSCLGHSNQAVIDAVSAQLNKIAYAHTSFFTSEPAEQLASMLVARAPQNIDRVYFVSGGSEAVEAAIKLARQFHLEHDQPQRQHVIARRQSYHGNTLGALSAGGNMWRRKQFEPLLSGAMHHIDACHYWRWGQANETARQYALRAADQLEAKIIQLGAESVSAFVVEPVVGATMGAVTAPPGYFQRIREICDRYGVLLIFDEVMCGMGRTGTLFACEAEQTSPDILCIAKGLGAGIQPIGAMLCTDRVYSAIADGSGFFQHGHTYLGHPAACAAGVAVMQQIEQHHLLANVATRGEQLQAALRQRFGNHPHVGDIRGRGLFVGVELVSDRASKDTFDPALRLHARLKKTAFDNGLMIYPMGGTIDGARGDHVLLAPPYIVEESQIEELVDKLALSLDQSLAAAGYAVAGQTGSR